MNRRPAAEAAARARHPTATWQPDMVAMAARLATRFEDEGREWPAFAAALVVARGRTGHDRSRFASLLGVAEAIVGDLEDGRLPPWCAPPGLADVAPDMDWSLLLGAASRAVPYALGRAGTADRSPAAAGGADAPAARERPGVDPAGDR